MTRDQFITPAVVLLVLLAIQTTGHRQELFSGGWRAASEWV